MLHLALLGLAVVAGLILLTVDFRRGKRREAFLESSLAAMAEGSSPPMSSVQHALVADGSQAVRADLGRILRDEGYQVTEAGDGPEALARLAAITTTSPTVLALVGADVAELNGFEFVEQVRSAAGYDAVRIVIMALSTDSGRLAAALPPGAAEILTKPFTTEALTMKIRSEPE